MASSVTINRMKRRGGRAVDSRWSEEGKNLVRRQVEKGRVVGGYVRVGSIPCQRADAGARNSGGKLANSGVLSGRRA